MSKVADVKAFASELRPLRLKSKVVKFTDPKDFTPDQIQTLRDVAAAYRSLLEYRRETSLLFVDAWRKGVLGQVWRLLKAEEPGLKDAWLTYFIRARGLGDIKIGKTNNIDSRFSSILTSCSRGADLIACYPAEIGHEKELHDEYFGDRLNGEWFRASDTLTDYLQFLGAKPREMTNLSPPPFQRRRRPDYVGGDL